MTQEEKDLLFKDLCARLHYKVLVSVRDFDGDDMTDILRPYTLNIFNGREDKIKPYLRPMSSMTEEEKREVSELGVSDDGAFHNDVYDVGTSMEEAFTAISWFLERHFDINYLIQRGLALEAPEGMYKNE